MWFNRVSQNNDLKTIVDSINSGLLVSLTEEQCLGLGRYIVLLQNRHEGDLGRLVSVYNELCGKPYEGELGDDRETQQQVQQTQQTQE